MDKKTIVAGGGVVINQQNEILLIFRRGKWDLPKGKIEPNETIEDCALREVKEETGIESLIIGNFITTTYHEYFDVWLKEDVVKESHWFYMSLPENYTPILIPQTSEDIELIEWVPSFNIPIYKENMYSTIIEVLESLNI